MKKLLLIALALIFCLSVIGCAQKKTSIPTTDPAVTTPPVATTEQKPADLPDPTYPEWVNTEGYNVVSSSVTNVFVTEDGAKTEYPARIMVLKNESKNPVLYLDVIKNNTVLCSNIWRGYCQMFINNEGGITVFQVIVNDNNSGNASVKLYDISDKKASGYDIIELEAPEINAVPEEGHSVKIAIGSEHALDMYKLQYNDLGFRFDNFLRDQTDKEVYMVADSYLDPENPSTYTYEEKISRPDFENREIKNKYELEYVFELYE